MTIGNSKDYYRNMDSFTQHGYSDLDAVLNLKMILRWKDMSCVASEM